MDGVADEIGDSRGTIVQVASIHPSSLGSTLIPPFPYSVTVLTTRFIGNTKWLSLEASMTYFPTSPTSVRNNIYTWLSARFVEDFVFIEI